jgi:hypothetical protein
MTEADWLAAEDPVPMLEFLQGKASDRKLRLLAVACVRGTVWRQLSDPTRQKAVEVAEQFADGQCTEAERGSAHLDAWLADGDVNLAGCAAREAASPVAWTAATDVLSHLREAVRRGQLSTESVTCSVSALRCIFGNPFRPGSIPPAVLTWSDATVLKLAQGIYEDSAFDHLPILADALEEAGYTEPGLLDHLHGPGPHVRGCHALDLLLAKQ